MNTTSDSLSVSWEDVNTYVDIIVSTRLDVHRIVAIHRGGLPFGTILSNRLELPLHVLFSSHRYDEEQDSEIKVPLLVPTIQNKCTVLLVDDISDHGDTLLEAETFLRNECELDVITVTLGIKEGTKCIPNYYHHSFAKHFWIKFPWE